MPSRAALRFIARVFMLAGLAWCASAQALTDIQFWHSMAGADSEAATDLVDRFNASQRDYRVVLTYKTPAEVAAMADTASPGAHAGPDLVQVMEPASATRMTQRRLTRPLYQVMDENRQAIDGRKFVPGMTGYLGEKTGRLYALPFNSSTAVLYYNKDAFKRAGLDPARPPVTWHDLQEAALAVKDTKTSKCGYTSDWQSWIQLENLASWHNQEFATKNNGMDGIDARLNFNNILMTRHIALLSSWIKAQIFTYAGRRNEGEAMFKSGDCAMFTGSSADLASLVKQSSFEVGVAPLPYYNEFDGAPFTSDIGGSSLWVMAGKKPAEYKGVAHFISYLILSGYAGRVASAHRLSTAL